MGNSKSSQISKSEHKKTIDSSSNSRYEANRVYYNSRVINEQNQTDDDMIIVDKQIFSLTVCKTELFGHWFIKLKVGTADNDFMNLHYVDIGSVLISKQESKIPVLSQTIYTPKAKVTLHTVLLKCHDIVQSKVYKKYSYNCQMFVTEIMEEFTERKTSKYLSIFPGLQGSAGFHYKVFASVFEKNFVEHCEKICVDYADQNDLGMVDYSYGLDEGLQYLEELNSGIQKDIDNLHADKLPAGISTDVTNQFLFDVLRPCDSASEQKVLEFLTRHKARLTDINKHMLKAWELANFLYIINNTSSLSELTTPTEAIQYCYIYQNLTVVERTLGAMGNWTIPKLILTKLTMAIETKTS